MVRYRFGAHDLLRTRFAIAPLMELVGAVYVLRDPGRYTVHRPWAEWARTRVKGVDLSLLHVAAPFGTPFWPVFIGPPPVAPRAEPEDEFRRVLATPPDRVAAEVARTYPHGIPPAAQRFIDEPDAALAELVDQMRTFWRVALDPWWPRLSAALESEIASRARRLVAVGAQAAFTNLHPTVSWDGDTLCVHPTKKPAADVDLAGRGLLLVPAAFTWPNVWPRTDPPWDPALVYPPTGTADLWAPDEGHDDNLGALLGRRRARILRELERPASTLHLARMIGVSPGSISDHLSVLRRAGLIAGRREGRSVIYARTATGHSLCPPTARSTGE
jgi:DNA-binding HxlR family transcriptional regulator